MKTTLEPISELIRTPCAVPWLGVKIGEDEMPCALLDRDLEFCRHSPFAWWLNELRHNRVEKSKVYGKTAT